MYRWDQQTGKYPGSLPNAEKELCVGITTGRAAHRNLVLLAALFQMISNIEGSCWRIAQTNTIYFIPRRGMLRDLGTEY